MSKAHSVRNRLDDLLAGLVEGDPVPAERELAARFGVARETIRQGMHELLVEGRIQRRGRGTVVAKPKLVQPLSLRSYTEGAHRMGRKPGRILVAWDDIEASTEIAAGLGIGAGDRVMHLERVLLADGEPIGLESTYLPAVRFGDLYRTFDPTTSLYAALRAAAVHFASAEERIETIMPTPREALLMSTTTAMPMLHLHRRSLDHQGRPIETVRALFRGDRVAFRALLVDEPE